MAKIISVEGLALCAGCEHGRIQDSLVPYCECNFAPYSSFCKHVPYGNTPYASGLRKKIRKYEKLLVGLGEKCKLAIKINRDIKESQRILERHSGMPKWRSYFIDQVNNKEVNKENGNTKQI